MRYVQYFTDPTHSHARREVYPSMKMEGAKTIRIASEPTPQPFRGFGVALTASSCYNLSLMEPAERRAFLESIYSEKGLGLSVARLSVGSSDYSAELYSYDDVEGDVALEHFSVERDEKYVIPMIREVLDICPDIYIFASPWSPPGWMKTGGSICGGYMRAEYVDCYAEYVVRFVEEYAKCGIRISALTPQNEPETQQHGQMPACIWHPDIEAAYVLALRRRLNERGLGDIGIWMYDYNFDNWVRPKWMLDNHPALAEACSGVAFHYYRGSIEQTRALKEAYPSLTMHFTEGGPRLFDNYGTDWCKWGIMMSKTLNEGFGSFTGWNLMLDETGGPNVGPYFCGGLVTRDSRSGALDYSGQYKAFRHISKFMQKGARVLELDVSTNVSGMFTFPKDAKPLQASLVENPDGSRVYVLVNRDSTKRQVQLWEDGRLWYVELLPDTLSTVVIE